MSAVATSGCLEAGEELLDEGEGDNGEETEETEDGAQESLSSARESFGTAAVELERIVKDDGYDFEDTDIRGTLEDGEDYLDEAGDGHLTEEQDQEMTNMRQLHRSLEGVVESAEAIGEALDDFEVALEHYDGDNFDAAVDRLQNAERGFERADGRLGTAEEQFDEIEAEIDRYDEIDTDAIRDVFNEYRSWAAAMVGMSEGLRDLSRGFERYYRATDDWEQENWLGAELDFDRAHDLFDDSSSTLLEAEEEVPPEFLDEMSDLTCEAEAMTDATEHFRRSMEAAQDENWDRFEDEVERGEEAAERCD